MATVKLTCAGRLHPVAEPLTLDFSGAQNEFIATTLVSVWVSHRAVRGGRIRRVDAQSPGNELVLPPNSTVWQNLTAGASTLTPSKAGTYTIKLVGLIRATANSPLTPVTFTTTIQAR